MYYEFQVLILTKVSEQFKVGELEYVIGKFETQVHVVVMGF